MIDCVLLFDQTLYKQIRTIIEKQFKILVHHHGEIGNFHVTERDSEEITLF